MTSTALVDRLRAKGLQLTAQRRAIAEALDGANRHLSPDELLVQARARMPEIGRATVYKALTAFTATGEVRQVQFDDGPTLYDPNAHVDHHHLVCERCGAVWDAFIDMAIPPTAQDGFTPTGIDVTVTGVCGECG